MTLNEKTLGKLFGESKNNNLQDIAEKVLLLSNQMKLTSTKYSSSKI